ncbi:MAG: hypothetical protein V1789_02310 [PVC group bacterium]
MNNPADIERPVVHISSGKAKLIFQTSPGIDYAYFVISADLEESPIIDEEPVPDSFFQGLKECEENDTFDLDIALNDPPPRS